MEAEKAFVPHCMSNTTAVHGKPFHMLEAERSLISNEGANSKVELVPYEVRIYKCFYSFKLIFKDQELFISFERRLAFDRSCKISNIILIPSNHILTGRIFEGLFVFQTKKLRTSPTESKHQKHEKKVNEKVAEGELTSSSDDEELRWLYKTRRGKKSRKALVEERHTYVDGNSKNENETDEIAEASAIKLISEEGQVNEKEDERGGRERSSKSSSIESSKTGSVVCVNEKPAKALIQKGPIKIKFKTNLLKTTIERMSELKRKEVPPGSIGLITKDGKVHDDATLVTAVQVVCCLLPFIIRMFDLPA